MKVDVKIDYAKQRAKEYPPIEEQVEALMIGGTELANMKALLQTIRAKYPKK